MGIHLQCAEQGKPGKLEADGYIMRNKNLYLLDYVIFIFANIPTKVPLHTEGQHHAAAIAGCPSKNAKPTAD